MNEYKHICFSCKKAHKCPCSEFDGVIGPTIGCPNYWPTGLAGPIRYCLIYGLVINIIALTLLLIWNWIVPILGGPSIDYCITIGLTIPLTAVILLRRINRCW